MEGEEGLMTLGGLGRRTLFRIHGKEDEEDRNEVNGTAVAHKPFSK